MVHHNDGALLGFLALAMEEITSQDSVTSL